MKDKISIIIPCLNEDKAIPIFYKEITKVFFNMKTNYELIFIDDGSTDDTLNVLRKLSKEDKKLKYISFSRNFGKEAGMTAGLKKSTGDYVAIMDVDMQDPPYLLEEMYKEIKKEEYDIVGLYTKSHEGYSFIRNSLTKMWYKLIDKISTTPQMPGARDFRLMTRRVVDKILELKEYNRYIKGIFSYVGFNTKWIAYDAPIRSAGESKFNLRKLVSYALEGIISFSTKPLIISAFVGMILCLISFISILVIIIKTIIWTDPVSGWPSMVCIMMFLSGIQLLFLGIIGLYLSKIYLEVKGRPPYIIKEEEEK